ncbi:MAG TPA: hypothetical protein VI670_12830 [Thermoanaerobaculia bacterium]|jgi:hypothetical protein
MSNTVPESTKLTPEAVIAQLHAMRSQIDEVTPLTQEQRSLLKRRLRRNPKSIVEASINVIGVLDNVSQAIGQPIDEVRQLQDDLIRWEAVADEARAFLKGIEGANLVRNQRLTLIGTQAYSIGAQLARDPAKAVLVPHVEEVKRLKSAARPKKKAKAAQKPSTTTTTAPDTSTAPKP